MLAEWASADLRESRRAMVLGVLGYLGLALLLGRLAGSGPALASVTVPKGGTGTATVRLPALWLTVKNASNQVGSGAKVVVTDTQCKPAS